MKFLLVLSVLMGSLGPCISDIAEKSYPRVTTSLGLIEGYYSTSFNGRNFEAYEGIPYAQPPVGDLRFEVAKTMPQWTDVMMAKEPSVVCMQYDYFQKNLTYKVTGSEDCLYLNVYAPERAATNSSSKVNDTENKLKPVIFFIHGGGFFYGTGSMYGPKYLLDKDLILVTVNYRLGPLGFLSTEDEVVPGNMGLKDQVVALRWVKDNIESFGGDPSRVTLLGLDAGGVSVHYHYLTNQTVGLFQGGISVSGTVLSPRSQATNPLEDAEKLAKIVGCPIIDTKSMVTCLKSRPPHQLVNAFTQFPLSYIHPSNVWTPSVEKKGSEFTYIDRNPIDIIDSGDAQALPWITGVVSQEALFPLAFYRAHESLFVELNDDWESLASRLLHHYDRIPKENQVEAAKLKKQYITGESPISMENFNTTVQIFTDWKYKVPVVITASKQAKANKSPVYVYYFSYRGAHSFTEYFSGTNENLGVCHGDDLGYVMDLPLYYNPTTTVKDLEMQKKLIDLTLSFATNGIPDWGIEWSSLNPSSPLGDLNLLHVAGPEDVRMENTTNFGNIVFWESLGSEDRE